MKSLHFGDRPNTLPHEDRTQGKEVEKEAQKRERVEGEEREGGERKEGLEREGRDGEVEREGRDGGK